MTTGRELFRETDAEFDLFYADAYGITLSYDRRSVEYMSLEEAREVRDELDCIIDHCEQYEEEFADL